MEFLKKGSAFIMNKAVVELSVLTGEAPDYIGGREQFFPQVLEMPITTPFPKDNQNLRSSLGLTSTCKRSAIPVASWWLPATTIPIHLKGFRLL